MVENDLQVVKKNLDFVEDNLEVEDDLQVVEKLPKGLLKFLKVYLTFTEHDELFTFIIEVE